MPAPSDLILSQPVARLALAAFLDIEGEPLRYALAPVGSLAMPASTILPAADPQFDGQTFTTLDPRFVTVSPVTHGDGGVEAVEFTVSGTLGMDADLMTALSNPARFRGRVARLWLVRLDDNWMPTHARPYYRGYMSTPSFSLEPADETGAARQTIVLRAENYLSLIGSGAPARSLLTSPDPDDRAADATVGASGASSALGGENRAGLGAVLDQLMKFRSMQ